MNNINILISTRGKKTTSIIIYGEYNGKATAIYDNRPWEEWEGQSATLAALSEIIGKIEEEKKAEILADQNRKRWTKSLKIYLLNELNYDKEYNKLKEIYNDLEKHDKYKEYIKNNIINYINIY